MLCFHLKQLPEGAVSSLVGWSYRNAIPAPPHTHSFCELFWVESGEGYHWINGEQRLMTTGYLALVRPEDVHAFSATEEGGEVYFRNFACPRAIWEQIRKRYFREKPLFFAEPDHRQREWQLGPATLDRVRTLAADLTSGYWDKMTTETFLSSLLALLYNRAQRQQATSHIPDWLAGAVEKIRLYPAFYEGTAQFVRLAGRSPEHVARECRRHYGKTPRDFINEARLDYAAHQLSISNQPILDIIVETGFENVGHFYRLFRRRFGRSPRLYRQASTGEATSAI